MLAASSLLPAMAIRYGRCILVLLCVGVSCLRQGPSLDSPGHAVSGFIVS